MNIELFLSKVEKMTVGDCWIWLGGLTQNGYGEYGWRSKRIVAHRWIFEYTNSVKLGSLCIHHKCKNKRCVNPKHLQAMTPSKHATLERTGQRRTHCKQGHEFTKNSIIIDSNGCRSCKICQYKRHYEYRVRVGLA